MSEEVEFYLAETKESMQHAYSHLEDELVKIRAGKASPSMLNGLTIEYYGSQTPLNQVSVVKTLDAKTLVITPFEKGIIQDIEKAIFQANLGVTPQNDGDLIRIVLPPTTEERRRDLVKQARHHGENAKISIRNARKDANEAIRDLVKGGASEDVGKNAEIDIQDLTDTYTKKIDALLDAKEAEIMKV